MAARCSTNWAAGARLLYYDRWRPRSWYGSIRVESGKKPHRKEATHNGIRFGFLIKNFVIKLYSQVLSSHTNPYPPSLWAWGTCGCDTGSDEWWQENSQMMSAVSLNGDVVCDCWNMPESLSTQNCKRFQAFFVFLASFTKSGVHQ